MGCSGSKEARERETGEDIVAPSGETHGFRFTAALARRHAACAPYAVVATWFTALSDTVCSES